ncbi:MAG: BTAD domain-containing putative transcriptional regulator [Nocardioides sp.]
MHAVGRTADALEVYQKYRNHLADELSLEPSQPCRRSRSRRSSPPAST